MDSPRGAILPSGQYRLRQETDEVFLQLMLTPHPALRATFPSRGRLSVELETD